MPEHRSLSEALEEGRQKLKGRTEQAAEMIGEARKGSQTMKKAAQRSRSKAEIPASREKTALVLSGGAARGAYEMGVWQALRELGVQPDMVCGTSIGAMNAYIVALGSFEKARDMWLDMKTEEVFDFDRVLQDGGGSFTGIKDILMEGFPEKDVRASQTDFGLCTVRLNEEASMDPATWTPLYLWREDIPEGQLMDYVLASCSCYPVVKPYEIDGRKYLDGGFYDYVPIRMALARGAERIIAVNLEAAGRVQGEDIEQAGARLTMIEPSAELGNFVVFDPANTRRIMRMGYLDTMKIYGAFEGNRFTFMKGAVDQRSLAAAERAGEILGLDSGVIYSRQSYRNALADAAAQSRAVQEGGVTLSKAAVFLAGCEALKKQGAGHPLKEAAGRIPLGREYNAALWLIRNGLV